VQRSSLLASTANCTRVGDLVLGFFFKGETDTGFFSISTSGVCLTDPITVRGSIDSADWSYCLKEEIVSGMVFTEASIVIFLLLIDYEVDAPWFLSCWISF
jgi:hypothetical protein